MGTNGYGFTPIDIAAVLYIVLTIIGLIIVYLILKRMLRKIGDVWSRGSLFGGDLKTRLISLGIVAVLFPSIFYSLGNAIINSISNFYVDVPQTLFTNWQTNQSVCADYYADIRLCVAQLGNGFIQAWTSALSDSLNLFGPSYIHYGKLILMLAVWAGVALILSATSSQDNQGGSEHKIRVQNLLDHLSNTTKQNIMFFLILVLAGYLSIAAIAAIPGLEETAVPSETVSVERLEQQMQDAFAQSQARIPEQLQFSELFVVPTNLSTPTTNDETTNYFSANEQEMFLKLYREQWSIMYSKLREDEQMQAENSIASALSTYRASVLERKGTKETVQHFLDIDAWFRQELNSMESRVAKCRRGIEAADSIIFTLVQMEEGASQNSILVQSLASTQKEIREACQSTAVIEPVPERRDLGSNMGPFSYIASWLLQTESLPLAQIVGLLGFGLLGSAVSSLVRGDVQRRKNHPLVEELATVIIRGATAAVVVFLAVKGGLAIFTSGESNPNSYVLLLTCLVAAVFSEDIWAEAHKRLSEGLTGNNKYSPPRAAPTLESPAPTETANNESTPDETQEDDSIR